MDQTGGLLENPRTNSTDARFATHYRCKAGGEWRKIDDFSKNQRRGVYSRMMRNQFVNAGNTGMTCRHHSGELLTTHRCNGPCNKTLPLEEFSRTTRQHAIYWCKSCCKWKEAQIPNAIPFAAPNNVVSIDETLQYAVPTSTTTPSPEFLRHNFYNNDDVFGDDGEPMAPFSEFERRKREIDQEPANPLGLRGFVGTTKPAVHQTNASSSEKSVATMDLLGDDNGEFANFCSSTSFAMSGVTSTNGGHANKRMVAMNSSTESDVSGKPATDQVHSASSAASTLGPDDSISQAGDAVNGLVEWEEGEDDFDETDDFESSLPPHIRQQLEAMKGRERRNGGGKSSVAMPATDDDGYDGEVDDNGDEADTDSDTGTAVGRVPTGTRQNAMDDVSTKLQNNLLLSKGAHGSPEQVRRGEPMLVPDMTPKENEEVESLWETVRGKTVQSLATGTSSRGPTATDNGLWGAKKDGHGQGDRSTNNTNELDDDWGQDSEAAWQITSTKRKMWGRSRKLPVKYEIPPMESNLVYDSSSDSDGGLP